MGVDRALVLFRKINHNLLQRRRITLATGYTLAQDLMHKRSSSQNPKALTDGGQHMFAACVAQCMVVVANY